MIAARNTPEGLKTDVSGDCIDVYFEAAACVNAAAQYLRKHAENAGVMILALQQALLPGSNVWNGGEADGSSH